MSISPIGSIASASAEVVKAVAKPAPVQVTTPTIKPDTVAISAAGHAASRAASSDGDSDAS